MSILKKNKLLRTWLLERMSSNVNIARRSHKGQSSYQCLCLVRVQFKDCCGREHHITPWTRLIRWQCSLFSNRLWTIQIRRFEKPLQTSVGISRGHHPVGYPGSTSFSLRKFASNTVTVSVRSSIPTVGISLTTKWGLVMEDRYRREVRACVSSTADRIFPLKEQSSLRRKLRLCNSASSWSAMIKVDFRTRSAPVLRRCPCFMNIPGQSNTALDFNRQFHSGEMMWPTNCDDTLHDLGTGKPPKRG